MVREPGPDLTPGGNAMTKPTTLAIAYAALAALTLAPMMAAVARAETPEEWVKLGARVHGGFGSFIPVGIRIGEDAMKRLNAKPRELAVTFYQGEGTPCACSADGVMLAVSASPGQGSLQVASEKSPPGTFAVVIIRPRKGGDGLRYTVPISMMPKLGQINSTIQDPLARYNAVMAIPDLFTVEPVK
jgi:formylmethanofuran dehydrogenase subunit E